MFSKIRRPSPAMVVASLALVTGTTGTSYAAISLSSNSVKSSHIKNGQVKSADLAANAVSSGKVKDGTLLAKDFKAGQLPAGAQGPAGPQGPQGVPGAQGAPGQNAFTDVQVVRSSIEVAADGSIGTFVSCPEGRKVIGGGAGWETGGGAGQYVVSSGPAAGAPKSYSSTATGDTPARWFGRFHNTTASAKTAYVDALCAS